MKKDFTSGNILKGLFTFSLPYMLSCFLQTFYGMADLYVTGQYNGSEAISAVSIGSQVMHMITVIIVGLAMGSTVLIGQCVGAGEKKRLSRAIGNTVILFMGISFVLTGGLLLCTDSIISVIETPPEAFSQAHVYLTICFAGIPFITAYNIISCIFRGLGDSRTPLYFVFVSCILNVSLDFYFIGHLGMGAAGAALATVISQAVSVIIAIIVIFIKKMGISLHRNDFIPHGQTMGKMIKIGIPISCQDGFVQVSFLFITMIANSRGLAVSASVGIVEKIISFLFLVPSSMLSSISSIAAQNVGAGKHDRARLTLKYGLTVVILFGLTISVAVQFAAPSALALFSDDPEVIKLGAQYFRGYVFDCIMAGIHFCFSGFFCAYGKSFLSFIQNAFSIVLVRVPGAWLASILFPATLFPMGLATALGSLLSAVICVIFYVKTDWEK